MPLSPRERSGVELAAVVSDMDTLKAQYGHLLFRLPMTFLEIFPVGLLVSLVSAAVLRRQAKRREIDRKIL